MMSIITAVHGTMQAGIECMLSGESWRDLNCAPVMYAVAPLPTAFQPHITGKMHKFSQA